MNFYEVPWGKVRVWCGLKHMFFFNHGFSTSFCMFTPWKFWTSLKTSTNPRSRKPSRGWGLSFPSGTLSFWDSLFHPLYNIYTVYMIRIKIITYVVFSCIYSFIHLYTVFVYRAMNELLVGCLAPPSRFLGSLALLTALASRPPPMSMLAPSAREICWVPAMFTV